MATAPKGNTGRQMRQAHTDAIETTKVIKRLNKQALDDEEMSAKAITAAGILLRKTLPDLKSTDMLIDGHLTVEPVDYGKGDADPDP